MKGIISLIALISDNWSTIVIAIAIILGVINRVRAFMKLSKNDKKEAALKIIKEEILKLMSDAEINWVDYKKSGQIKRSEVITKIYTQFPELASVVDQETVMNEIDKLINESKDTMDTIFEKNTDSTDSVEN